MGATGVDEQSAYQLGYAGGALADLAASLRVRGTNEVNIFGERGALRLCEPFYRAHRLVLQPHAPSWPAVDGESQPKSRGLKTIIGAARDNPTTKLLKRRLDPLLARFHGSKGLNFPFAGNGYQFELQEVSNCLQEQRTESAIMSLDDSLEVMRIAHACDLGGLKPPALSRHRMQ